MNIVIEIASLVVYLLKMMKFVCFCLYVFKAQLKLPYFLQTEGCCDRLKSDLYDCILSCTCRSSDYMNDWNYGSINLGVK